MLQSPNILTHYTFTSEEQAAPLELAPLTKAKLQTKQADNHLRLASLRVDAANPAPYIQEQAYLVGQLELLAEMLEDRVITPSI